MTHPHGTLGVSTGSHAAGCFERLCCLLPSWRIEAFEQGRDLEDAILSGKVEAVVELNLGDLDNGRTNPRLTAASFRGIPQVVVPAGFAAGLSDDEMDGLGKQIAMRTSASRGPVRIVVPRDANGFLLKSLRLWLSPHVALIETDLSVDDPRFAEILADHLERCVAGQARS